MLLPFAFHGANEHLKPHLQKVLNGEYNIAQVDFRDKNPIVLDLGANIGSYAYWIFSRWPNAHLISFEPSSENCDAYVENMYAAGVDPWRYRLVNAAVYPTTESHIRIFTSPVNTGMHSADMHYAGGSSEKYFDALVAHPNRLPDCTILKMDIEGCEVPVLRAYLASRATLPQLISFEFHSRFDRYELDQILGDNYLLGSGLITHADLGTLNYFHKDIKI